MLRCAPLLALLIAICLHPLLAQPSSKEALELIDRVADHYSQAKSVHLEATITRSSKSDLYDYSSVSHLIAWTADGKRFRYDGSTSAGSGLIVSDGTSEWHLRRSFAQYDKAPSGSFFKRPISVGSDDDAPVEARRLLTVIVQMHGTVDLARFAPSEPLEIHSRKIKCTVIQFEYKQNVDRDPTQPMAWRNTIWIDPSNLTVLKIEYRDRHQMMQGMFTPPHAGWRESRDSTLYTVADLEPPIPPDTFTLTPLTDTTEVASLPSLFPIPGAHDNGISPNAGQYVGKPLPAIVVHDATGADVSLSHFNGHPLLIDVWATWCGPCIHDLPALAKLRASTSATDLQIIGIDEDQKTTDAIAYLKHNNYDWPNYHLTESAEKQLSAFGIPVTLLVDANGTVAYYHVGENVTKDLVSAVHKLGPAYANASAD